MADVITVQFLDLRQTGIPHQRKLEVGSEIPERRSPRVPLQLRTSSSESDGVHSTNRPVVDRSPKIGDRRSPRNPIAEKKRGPRISDLEAQLSQTQEEVKKLKQQLAAVEAAKKDAQEELEKTKKQIPAEEPQQIHESKENSVTGISPEKLPEQENAVDENFPETDVFEVPLVPPPAPAATEASPDVPAPAATEASPDMVHAPEKEDIATKPIEFSEPLSELEKPPEVASPENAEISELKAKLAEKEKELEIFCSENDELKRQVSDAAAEASVARAREEEAALKLSHIGIELEESKSNTAKLADELKAIEGAKLALETEMKKLRVQTEQWRKAADAAAAVLAGGADMNGRIAERCSSMDKHHHGGFESVGYPGFGSPMSDLDELGSGKRKGAGIRMFGDLWKKKGQK
ncbi:hypothetical protein ACLOJK_008512 [Asimina triloba]